MRMSFFKCAPLLKKMTRYTLFFQLSKSIGKLLSYKKAFNRYIWPLRHKGNTNSILDSDWIISGPSIKGVQWCSMSFLLYLYSCLSLSGTLWVFTFSLYFDCGLVSILVCYKWTTRRTQIDQKSTIYLKPKQLCHRQFKSVQKVWKKWFSLLSPHLFLFLLRLCCLSTCYVILKPTECV